MIEWRILQNKYVVTREALDAIGDMGEDAARKRRRAESETAVCGTQPRARALYHFWLQPRIRCVRGYYELNGEPVRNHMWHIKDYN